MDDDFASFIFASFCDQDKIYKYLEEFRICIQTTENVIDLNKSSNFFKCLRVLEKGNLIDSLEPASNESSQSRQNVTKKFNDILVDVLEIFCFRHLKIILQTQNDFHCHSNEIAITLDIVAYLIKKYTHEISGREYIEVLIDTVCMFFQSVEEHRENYTNISESHFASLFYNTLKFVARVFQCIPSDSTDDYFSENYIFNLIENLPLADATTVKIFVNHIFPSVINFFNEFFKDKLFLLIWKVICKQYNSLSEAEILESNSCIYTLFCCLSEYIFSNRVLQFAIHNEIIFWKIILSGLTCNFPFTRKKSLNVFKILLAWVNKGGTLSDSFASIQPNFCVKLNDNMKTWNDVIILFESLEEKQIHIIKPILPKFTRILLLTKEENASLPGENFDLPSSWIMALLNRMLNHETKFVVKWALSTILELDFSQYFFHHHNFELLIKLLLEAFNDQTLYSRNNEQDNYSLFLSSEKISLFLKKFLLSSPSLKVDILKCILETTASQTWGTVALMHLMFALSELDSLPSWDQFCLPHIRKIVLDCQRSHELVFRTALEYFLLECCTLFLDWNTLTCDNLAELLTIFKSPPVLRHSKPWKRFAAQLKKVILKGVNSDLNRSTCNEFCIQSIHEIIISKKSDVDIDVLEIEKVAKILLMFADSDLISHKSVMSTLTLNWDLLLDPVVFSFQCAPQRPYLNNKTFLSCIKLLSYLIKESNGCKQMEDEHTSSLMYCINSALYSNVNQVMLQKLFTDVESNSYISQNNIIFDAFHVFTVQSECKNLYTDMVPTLIEKIQFLLGDSQYRRFLLFPLWKMLNNVVLGSNSGSRNPPLCSVQKLNYQVIWKVTNENLLFECLTKPPGLDRIEKEQWLQFSYNAVCNFWDVSSSAIQHFTEDEIRNVTLPLAEEAQKVFNNGPKIAVPYAIKCMRFLLPKLGVLDFGFMLDFLEASWKACLELRGNEAFRPSLISFVEIILQKEMLGDMYCTTLDKYIGKFKELSESTIGIFYDVIKQFCDTFTISDLVNSKLDYLTVFVSALTFGSIHQKAHKIMEESLLYIIERDSAFENSLTLFENNKPSCYVRTVIINYLLKNLSKDNESLSFEIAKQLMKVDIDDNGKQTSHFANSLSHRVRNRAWQSILLLQKTISNEDLNEQLLLLTLNILGCENQQPSIRYLQEWLIFNIVQENNSILNKYILLFEQSLEKRPSYIISILSVTNLLILNDLIINECDVMRCFKLITVLCMAQNFTVRLYAQMALTNLFSLCQQKNMCSAILQYEFVLQLTEMQQALAGQGNFFKNVVKLSNDFYFSRFKPTEHFSMETIFYELPRLSNLTPDEWIKPSLFSEKKGLNIPIFNSDDTLKKSIPTSWSYKSGTETPTTEESSLDYNFQKKIMPIKNLINDFEGLELVEGHKSRRDGLIVVASLIDRIPNLGGLCRTCEVFAVSEFVIGSFKYIEDKNFQTLACSADKWVSIKEVKPNQLQEYLVSMKDEGYVLVGAEQTEDSCTLSDYKFPKKSILVLGHEKEGLPVDLIKLLDVCVEIPQQGVVRSLNVHVSGAILIWEYARQHIKPS